MTELALSPSRGPLCVSRQTLTALGIGLVATGWVAVAILQSEFAALERPLLLTSLSLYFAAIVVVLKSALHAFRRARDLTDPWFVACITFAVYHVLFIPLVVTTPKLLLHRGLDGLPEEELKMAYLVSYPLLLVSWYGMKCGYHLAYRWLTRALPPFRQPKRVSWIYVLIGLLFVGVGVLGNAAPLGGISAYVKKAVRFFEAWESYRDATEWGGMKWTIAQKFLPVGMLILAVGTALRFRLRKKPLVALFCVAAVANVFLNCAVGGRSQSLMAAFYLLIAYNYMVARIPMRLFATLCGFLLILSIVLGVMRDLAFLGVGLASLPTFVLQQTSSILAAFAGLYLTNYVGTLRLTAEVLREGVIWGKTAFAGLTGLLGGSTPLTTQSLIWYRITGSYEGSNPRYGPPGELYLNFGWPGVLLGMALLGAALALLTFVYRSMRGEPSVRGAVAGVFCTFSANFLVIANLSYIPPYFTYFAAPAYLAYVALRKRRC